MFAGGGGKNYIVTPLVDLVGLALWLVVAVAYRIVASALIRLIYCSLPFTGLLMACVTVFAGISASSATVSPRYLLIAVILAFSLLVLIILLLLCVIQRSRTGTYRGTATAARCISVKACSQHTN